LYERMMTYGFMGTASSNGFHTSSRHNIGETDPYGPAPRLVLSIGRNGQMP